MSSRKASGIDAPYGAAIAGEGKLGGRVQLPKVPILRLTARGPFTVPGTYDTRIQELSFRVKISSVELAPPVGVVCAH